jgi:diphosphomevalonate decarboxylase
MTEGIGSARAPANIALVKYWGKRDERLNLPEAGSLSVTLEGLEAHTTVRFGPSHPRDQLILDGHALPEVGMRRAVRILDRVREVAGVPHYALVQSTNSFPTAAGLASSAAGMAALALAASRAAGWDPSAEEASVLARLGSGSACRSIHGGFVEWIAGSREDGVDSHAVGVASPEHWPLEATVVLISEGEKPVSSTRGMAETAASSPYHAAWISAVRHDLPVARAAVLARDFDALSAVAEGSCLAMHATMMAARPALCYWKPGTLQTLDAVARLRAEGRRMFFTIDAGPNVKVFAPPGDPDGALGALEALLPDKKTLRTRTGPGGSCVDETVSA